MNKYSIMFRYGDVRKKRECKEFIVYAETSMEAINKAMLQSDSKFDIQKDFTTVPEQDFVSAINKLFYEETFQAEIQHI